MFSILDSVAFDNALDRYYDSMMPTGCDCPPLVRCPHCGKRLYFDKGDVVEVFDTPDGFIHKECFEEYMNEKYGEGQWRECEDDGMGGYYEFNYCGDGETWEGTGIYYTEFEHVDDQIIDWDKLNKIDRR